jgi:hypothetical protein
MRPSPRSAAALRLAPVRLTPSLAELLPDKLGYAGAKAGAGSIPACAVSSFRVRDTEKDAGSTIRWKEEKSGKVPEPTLDGAEAARNTRGRWAIRGC